MIDLNIQIKLLLFSLIFGFIFSSILDFLYQFIYKAKSYLKITLSILLICLMTIIYFIGIDRIGNGIFHLYSILSIIIGFIGYDLLIKKLANHYKK